MAGFEPTTLWFVARYSIQLSYIRTRGFESYILSLKKESFIMLLNVNNEMRVNVLLKRGLRSRLFALDSFLSNQ